MAKRLTDEQKKQIIADYVQCSNCREVARKYGIHHATVKRIVEADDDFIHKATEKQKENTRSVMEHMESRREQINALLDDLLRGMSIKAQKPDVFTSIKDMATAYGILIDKALKAEELRQGRENTGNTVQIILERGRRDGS